MLKSVTIGIPAHNEERNIANLLDSILMQKNSNFRLETVYVACDGCNDNTVNIVKEYSKKYEFIKLIDDGKRLGQIGRLNQFYKLAKTDILINFDADIILSHKRVVEEVVKSFDSPLVGLVGCNDLPFKGGNLVEQMGSVWIYAWYEMRKDFNNGNSVNNHHGCASALSKSFYRQIQIPINIVSNDDYLYFKAVQLDFEFRFAKKTSVYYKVPSTLNEFFMQTTRFLSLKHKVAEHFGDWVYDYYEIPTAYKLKGLLTTFIKNPFIFSLAIIFQILQRILKSHYLENYEKGLWTTIQTSK